jgi:hypothetical protein
MKARNIELVSVTAVVDEADKIDPEFGLYLLVLL